MRAVGRPIQIQELMLGLTRPEFDHIIANAELPISFFEKEDIRLRLTYAFQFAAAPKTEFDRHRHIIVSGDVEGQLKNARLFGDRHALF